MSRLLAALLGAVVAWQFVAVPAGCVLDAVPADAGPVRAAVEGWGQATGTTQGWPLFACGHVPLAVFPAAEFRFHDGTAAEVRSGFEPAASPAARLAPWRNRLFNYEMRLTLVACHMTPEAVAARPADWRAAAESDGRATASGVRAYLLRAWAGYQAAHPDASAPAELVLVARPYRAGDSLPPRPAARCRLGTGAPPVEVADPVAGRFPDPEEPRP